MRPSLTVATLAACAAALAGCGTSTTASTATTAPAATPAASSLATTPASSGHVLRHHQPLVACTAAAQGELVTVARRIYAQAVGGRNEAASVARIARSTTLPAALTTGDPATVQAALRPLIKSQITAIRVFSNSGRKLASYGTAAAYAPVKGQILQNGQVVGSYVLSVSDDRAFESLLSGLTGVTSTFARKPASHATATIAATAFPSGAETISLSIPPLPHSLCGQTTADTVANTIGYVGHKLAVDEQHGPDAQRSLHAFETSHRFRNAVVARDPSALWNAIVGFFRDSQYHIVRVRAWDGKHVINDVGGPYVLNPAQGVLHGKNGAIVGRFMLAIQDDTGYIKLMHRFTGAEVVLHMAGKTVPGSNEYPGPAYAPGLTHVTYRGKPYRDVGLLAVAFPSSPLQVSLLVPAGAGAAH